MATEIWISLLAALIAAMVYGSMMDQETLNDSKYQPESWLATIAGALLFLLAGLELLSGDIPHAWGLVILGIMSSPAVILRRDRSTGERSEPA